MGRTIKKEFLPGVRCTPRFKANVEKRAIALEKSVSEYIRALIEQDMGPFIEKGYYHG